MIRTVSACLSLAAPGRDNLAVVSLVTVSLVSRVPSFCCDGCTVEINTSIESSWSAKLNSVGYNCNRAIFDGLMEAIVCAAGSVNRFL